MRVNIARRLLGLILLSTTIGCVQQGMIAPSSVSLDAEAGVMLARVYDEPALAHSLALHGLAREALESEVLRTCSIAYSIAVRTENKPKERAHQMRELHGSPYYIAEENRCVETLIANKVADKQWQRIHAGQFIAGELLHIARFDTTLAQFTAWAEQVCPARQSDVTAVFQALERRITRQQRDVQLLRQHYLDPKRLARVMSWHSGRRLEDYSAAHERARQFAESCRATSSPTYKGLTL